MKIDLYNYLAASTELSDINICLFALGFRNAAVPTIWRTAYRGKEFHDWYVRKL